MRPVEAEPILKFSQIKGQDQPTGILRRALESKRLPHAYLFEGPEGVGKKTCALALACAIHCRQPRNGEACGICPACHKVALKQHPGETDEPDYPILGHPDLGLIEPDGQFIRIEGIRKLQQRLTYKPFESWLKVYIIDEAERMNSQSANCLLKTLEEPPDNSLIILVSANPYHLLPTIRSRCQRLAFNQLSIQEIGRILSGALDISETQSNLIARFAQGSLGQALNLNPQEVFEQRETVFAWLKPGKFSPGQSLTVLARAYSKDSTQLQCLVNWLVLIFRDLLAIRHGAGADLIDNRDRFGELAGMAAVYSRDWIQRQLAILQEVKGQLQRNINPQLILETIFVNLV